jgi:hypothetical protein
MIKHVSLIFDYLKKKDYITAEDYLKYYFQFDEEGKIRKIVDKRILQTIEEMPKLVRQSRKPDVIKQDDYSQVIDIPVMKEEASPEADIQNLYDEFVAQINNGLASLGDIKTYPQMLSELYQLIRPQIYPKDRVHVLKKVKEMISQLDDLALKLSKNPSKVYTLSRIYIPDTTRGLYPEEKVIGKYSVVKEQPQRLMRLPQEDLPILQRDVVDFFENIPAQQEPEIYHDEMIPSQPSTPKRKYAKKTKPSKPSSDADLKTRLQYKLSKKTVAELKQYMKDNKIKGLTGKKQDLLDRIIAHASQQMA